MKTYYHGTTISKGLKILKQGLKARFYEPEWFTITDDIDLAWYHANLRNKGNGCVIRVSIPDSLHSKYIFKAGGLKQHIPTRFLSKMTKKELSLQCF